MEGPRGKRSIVIQATTWNSETICPCLAINYFSKLLLITKSHSVSHLKQPKLCRPIGLGSRLSNAWQTTRHT
jgi:hypothetical protein